jgi:hypothetical protein
MSCSTIGSGAFGWGGAISIKSSVSATALTSNNFEMKDLIFSESLSEAIIGFNIHIQSPSVMNIG